MIMLICIKFNMSNVMIEIIILFENIKNFFNLSCLYFVKFNLN